MFQKECASVSYTITSIPGGFAKYLTTTTSSTRTAVSPTSTFLNPMISDKPNYCPDDADSPRPASCTPLSSRTSQSPFGWPTPTTTSVSSSSINTSPSTTNTNHTATKSAVSSESIPDSGKKTRPSPSHMVAAILGSVGGLVIAAGMVYFIVRRRKRTVALMGHHTPGYAPNTTFQPQMAGEDLFPQNNTTSVNMGASKLPLSELQGSEVAWIGTPTIGETKNQGVSERRVTLVSELDGLSVQTLHSLENCGLGDRNV